MFKIYQIVICFYGIVELLRGVTQRNAKVLRENSVRNPPRQQTGLRNSQFLPV